MRRPKHILVLRFSAMGDVAIIVPVLLALLNQNKGLKVTVVTRPFFEPIFKEIPNVSVFTPDFKGKHKGIPGLYRLSRALLKLDFDAIADLHNVLRTKIIKVFLFNKRALTIDKGRQEKKALTTRNIFKPLKPTTARYAEVFKALGCNVDLSNPIVLSKPSLDIKAKVFLGKNGVCNIGIAPFAAHKGKMYPLSLMEEVISQLAEDYNIILFGGGQREIEILNTLEESYNNVSSVAGKLSFKDELALISNMDLMLSMDSGNGHLAAMYGVKVVTVWGVTHPYAGFEPFNQPESYALTADRDKFPLIPTSVYGNKYPRGYEDAAASVSPQQIVEKITSICPKIKG